MIVADIYLPQHPRWQRSMRPRLAVSIGLAVLLIGLVVLVVRFEAGDAESRQLELRLLSPDVAVTPEPAAETEPEPALPEQTDEPAASIETAAENTQITDEPVPKKRDWYSQLDDVVRATVAQQQNRPSVNPGFDAKRRQAAVKFAPSKASQSKPVWENVETDQMGRKILVSGDCHRIVDDPSAANYEIFRTFQQYIVYCTKRASGLAGQPWVDDIRDRYDYLAQHDAVDDAARADYFVKMR